VSVSDFSSLADGTDWTDAYRAAMAVVRTTGGGTVDARNLPVQHTISGNIWSAFRSHSDAPGLLLLPAGEIRLTAMQQHPSNWDVVGLRSGSFSGSIADYSGTRFRWTGGANAVMWRVFESHHGRLANVVLDGNNVDRVTLLEIDSAGAQGTTGWDFDVIGFYNFTGDAVRWGTTNPNQADRIKFYKCHWLTAARTNGTSRAVVINSLNAAQDARMEACFFQQVNVAVDIVRYQRNLALVDCDCGELKGEAAAFVRVQNGQALLVENCRFENQTSNADSRFMRVTGADQSVAAVTLVSCDIGGGRQSGPEAGIYRGIELDRGCRVVTIGCYGAGRCRINDPDVAVVSVLDRFPDNTVEGPNRWTGWEVSPRGAGAKLTKLNAEGVGPTAPNEFVHGAAFAAGVTGQTRAGLHLVPSSDTPGMVVGMSAGAASGGSGVRRETQGGFFISSGNSGTRAHLRTTNDFGAGAKHGLDVDENGNAILTAVGAGYRAREGRNATMGVVVLAAGVARVETNRVTANSRIFLTAQRPAGVPGALYVSARTAGAAFMVSSTSRSDASTVAWLIIEPA
jgi:hypothetical protein